LEFSVAGWSDNLDLLWPHIRAFSLYLIPFSYMPCLVFRYKPHLILKNIIPVFLTSNNRSLLQYGKKISILKKLVSTTYYTSWLTISTSGYNPLLTKLRLFLRFDS
jgi:hypothetical protein